MGKIQVKEPPTECEQLRRLNVARICCFDPFGERSSDKFSVGTYHIAGSRNFSDCLPHVGMPGDLEGRRG